MNATRVRVCSIPGTRRIPSVTTREVLVLAHPDHDDEVVVARDRIDLGNLREIGDLLGRFGDAVDVAVGEDNGGNHLASVLVGG